MRIKGVRKNLTLEDRVEVVKHYLEISRDYSETAIKFEVSYQQVYQWVQKYNKFGVDGLIDRRGKRKAEDELTEVEKLKLNIKLLEAKNRRIELENAFLKKLNELEGV
ncbi:transposase IS3/IS911 family protein [Phascolarctobacterium sp. CAG:266]|nr:transposase IS3/IS911 family protein [Phascolarctobacterium sp. CAG:266]